MGFVRVSGYSKTDLELAKLNAARNFEIYYSTKMTDGSNTYLTYKFGKDYAWAMIIISDMVSTPIWTGTSTPIFLSYRWQALSTEESRDYKIKTDTPNVVYIPAIKKGDIYGRTKQSGEEVDMFIIACPYEDTVGQPPEDGSSGSGTSFNPAGGFCMGSDTYPTRKYAAINMHYGVNNNRWYMEDSADPTHALPPNPNIPEIVVIPTASGGSNSGGDTQDPVNPGEPDGPTGD